MCVSLSILLSLFTSRRTLATTVAVWIQNTHVSCKITLWYLLVNGEYPIHCLYITGGYTFIVLSLRSPDNSSVTGDIVPVAYSVLCVTCCLQIRCKWVLMTQGISLAGARSIVLRFHKWNNLPQFSPQMTMHCSCLPVCVFCQNWSGFLFLELWIEATSACCLTVLNIYDMYMYIVHVKLQFNLFIFLAFFVSGQWWFLSIFFTIEESPTLELEPVPTRVEK